MGNETIQTGAQDALIVVDVQRDFCPGGALGVADGNQVVPIINRLVPMFGRWIYTRDWHPANHMSFAANPEFHDGSWPPHAVQGTPGAGWCEDLEMPEDAVLVNKGENPAREAYSGFKSESFDLAGCLRTLEVRRVFIAGLATDYCVRETALDGRAAGFDVYLVEDATRGVAPETTKAALEQMEAAGVRCILSTELQDSGERPPAPQSQSGDIA